MEVNKKAWRRKALLLERMAKEFELLAQDTLTHGKYHPRLIDPKDAEKDHAYFSGRALDNYDKASRAWKKVHQYAA